ncbi:hypothetical protein Cgig2_009274 [Carnegiea gigantea]|uniref:Uncharacterized protein n=1 Tax=Carnegiea gigantea TaxID=171969 RepID=A0A9Q1K033_9CARY|nr:hypothetical protein Cgig2_009274 [Carnegiea gigantea]
METLESVEDFTTLWTFDESFEDVERQFQSVTNELAVARKAAIEQRKTHKENIQKLFHLLSIVCKERDEAKDQLRKLMMSNSKMTSQSNVSSSFSLSSLDSVGAGADNLSSCDSSHDRGTATIEGLAKGRPRPEKGKLLQSVMEAGPLLDTLLVAGSLPQWRDPPPMRQDPQVPPVPIKGYKAQAQAWAHRMGVTSDVLGTPSTSSTINMLNFGGALSGSYLVHGAMGLRHQITMGKRQRI